MTLPPQVIVELGILTGKLCISCCYNLYPRAKLGIKSMLQTDTLGDTSLGCCNTLSFVYEKHTYFMHRQCLLGLVRSH